MERNLVTLRKIIAIEPIANASAIELAHIDGWQCVVKKDQFKTGDEVIYFEIDSFLPEIAQFEFLRKGYYTTNYDGSKGFRVKTIKLRGVLSQGLIMPLYDFPQLDLTKDLAQQIGVKKFEKPIPVSLIGKVKGSFPFFIPKTDQERIQNLPEYFTKYKDVKFECTIKLDGTSATYYFKDGVFGVCSRNLELYDDNTNLYWNIARKYQIETLMRNINRNIALQGEIIGAGINKNPERLVNNEFHIFDIFDIDKNRYFTPEERKKFYDEYLSQQLPHVRVVISDFLVLASYPTIEKLLEFADGPSISAPIREGLVCKSSTTDEFGVRISFKVINNKYLLNED
jgi:RNA ligase (TIGR02306 family)